MCTMPVVGSISTQHTCVDCAQPPSPPSQVERTSTCVSDPAGSRGSPCASAVATSASGMPVAGAPLTATRPSTSSRSAGEASSRWEARSRIVARASRAATVIAPPAIAADRLPPVPNMLNGVARVSPYTTRTESKGTPISSATTWASVVW